MATKPPIPQDFMDSGTWRSFQSLAASPILGSFSPPEMSSGCSVLMTSGWDDHSLSNALFQLAEDFLSPLCPARSLRQRAKHHYEPPGAALSARKAYFASRIKLTLAFPLDLFPTSDPLTVADTASSVLLFPSLANPKPFSKTQAPPSSPQGLPDTPGAGVPPPPRPTMPTILYCSSENQTLL